MKYFIVFCVALAHAKAWIRSPGKETTITEFTKSNYSLNLICPGTKWCGNGDIANSYDDLGKFWNVDICCRAHDFCDDNIVAGATGHGLANDGYFTKSHCKCDMDFYVCLQSSDCVEVASAIGMAYFDAWRPQCFDLRAPATCIKKTGLIRKRCVEYSYDDTKSKEWQWFDPPEWTYE